MKLAAAEKYNIDDRTENKQRVAVTISNVGHHLRVLAESTYSRPIEAVVRETIANAIDASRGAQFEVTVPSLLDPNFKVRDRGVGMSEEFFTTGYAAVGFSTKRDANDEIGGFGQGRFAAFAYQGCDQFYVRGFKDGKMFLGSVYRNSDFEIFVQVEARGETDEPNGVEVIIPVQVADHKKFHDAVQIFTEFLDPQPDCCIQRLERKTLFEAADKSWKITSFEHITVDGEPIRAVMGGIPYKLDLIQVFGYDSTSTMNIKVADLHFPIGKLSVPASREELRYDDATKAAIRAKFKEMRAGVDAHIAAMQASLKTDWEKWTDPSIVAFKTAMGQSCSKTFRRSDFVKLLLLHSFKRVNEFSGRSTMIDERFEVRPDSKYLIYLVDDEKSWRRKIGTDAMSRIGTDKGRIIVVGSLTDLAVLGDPPYTATSSLPMPPKAQRMKIVTTGGTVAVKHTPSLYEWNGPQYKWVENTTPDFTVKDRIYIPFKISRLDSKYDHVWSILMGTDKRNTIVGVPAADLALAKKAGWLSIDEYITSLETPDRLEAARYIASTPGLYRYPMADMDLIKELGVLLKNGFKLPATDATFGRKMKLVLALKQEMDDASDRLSQLSDKFKAIKQDSKDDLTKEFEAFRNAHPFFAMTLDAEIYSKAFTEKKVDVPTLLAAAKKAL